MTEDYQAPRVQHVHCRNSASRREEKRAGTCAWREAADDTSEEELDASALLQFVNLVSSDIKSVLSKSHKSRRAVDHRKYLQRKIARLVRTASGTTILPVDTKPPDCVYSEHWPVVNETDQMTNICSSNDRVSQHPEKYTFLLPPHPAAMNAYPTTTSLSLGAERHHDHKRISLGSFDRDCSQQYRDKPGVPLRQRHLPASFWKEPNVPKYPFLPQFTGMVPLNFHQQGLEYKEFIDRLQAGQLHGLTTIGSRFPITEFLYYNYGMKNKVDGSTSHYNDSLWPLGFPQPKKHVNPSVPGLPAVCPYLGCNCTTSTPEVTHKGQEGHRSVPPPLDLLQSSVWKPVPTKSLSSYPTRYHPFAHAR